MPLVLATHWTELVTWSLPDHRAMHNLTISESFSSNNDYYTEGRKALAFFFFFI